MDQMRLHIACLALVAAYSTSCGPVPTTLGDEPPVDPWQPPANLDWGPCADAALVDVEGIECTTLAVRLRPDLEGDVIELALTRAPAANLEERIGVLVVHPGGPGIPSGTFVMAIRDRLWAAGDRFDIVGVDWRGVGASTPRLDCLSDAEQEAAYQSSDTADLGGSLDELLAGCREAVGDDVLSHVDTTAAVHDLEWVRMALGEEQLNFLGVSYGTKLGAAYASVFPDRVRAFILDAPVSPDRESFEMILGQAQAMDEALDDFFVACGAAPGCAFHGGSGTTTVAGAFDQLGASIGDEGVLIGDRRIFGSTLRGVTRSLLSAGAEVYLGDVLADLESGDGGEFLSLVDVLRGRQEDGSYTEDPGEYFGVFCADYFDDEGPSAADVAAFVETIAVDFPRLQGGAGLIGCTNWTRANLEPIAIDASEAPPLFVIAGAHDPATPPRWADDMVAALNNGSSLYVSDHLGHGSTDAYYAGRHAQAFLVNPSRDPSGPFYCAGVALDDGTTPFESFTVSVNINADPPAPADTVALVQFISLDDDTVLAEGTMVIGGEPAELTIQTGGQKIPGTIRASAAGYRTAHSFRGFPYSVNTDQTVTLVTEERMTEMLGAGGFDPALAAIAVSTRDCDGALSPGALALEPAAGNIFHKVRSSSGVCQYSQAAASTDDCGGAVVLNVAPGTYRLVFHPTGEDGVEVALDTLRVTDAGDFQVTLLP